MERIFILSEEDLKRALADVLNSHAKYTDFAPPKVVQVESNSKTDSYLNVSELCAYLPSKPQRSSIYRWIKNGQIPYFRDPGRKKIRFLKSSIDKWLGQNGQQTSAEQYSNTEIAVSDHLIKQTMSGK